MTSSPGALSIIISAFSTNHFVSQQQWTKSIPPFRVTHKNNNLTGLCYVGTQEARLHCPLHYTIPIYIYVLYNVRTDNKGRGPVTTACCDTWVASICRILAYCSWSHECRVTERDTICAVSGEILYASGFSAEHWSCVHIFYIFIITGWSTETEVVATSVFLLPFHSFLNLDWKCECSINLRPGGQIHGALAERSPWQCKPLFCYLIFNWTIESFQILCLSSAPTGSYISILDLFWVLVLLFAFCLDCLNAALKVLNVSQLWQALCKSFV